MSDAHQDHLQTTTREVETVIAATQEMSIRKLDWTRIYRKVKSVPREPSVYKIASAIAYSISATSLLSLIPLYAATGTTDPWVRPLYWILGISALVLGSLTLVLDKQSSQIVHASCDEVLQDMRDVHEAYYPGDDLDAL